MADAMPVASVLTILAAWFAAAALTAATVSALANALKRERRPLSERRRRRLRATASQALLLAAAVTGAALTSVPQDWQPLPLVFLLAALALGCDAMPLTLGRYRFTGGFVAIVLAMALLGPAPAVAIGVLCAGVDAARTRPDLGYLLNNLAAYATFALAGGLTLAAVDGPVLLAVACVGVAVAVNLLNFLVIAAHAAIRDGDPLLRAFRTTWLPVLNWEVATALVAGATVYGYAAIGPVVVAGFAISLAILQIVAARIAAASADPARHILKTP